MTSAWGSSWGTAWGNSWGTTSAAEEDNGWLGGGGDVKRYSYATPYQKIQAARKDVVDVKAAIDHAAIEKAALQAKLEKAIQSKAKKQAETQRKLEQKLLKLEGEILRLVETLQMLEALMREWDEEDALIALSLSNPFLTLKL